MRYLLLLLLCIGCSHIELLAQPTGNSHFSINQYKTQLTDLGNIKLDFSNIKLCSDANKKYPMVYNWLYLHKAFINWQLKWTKTGNWCKNQNLLSSKHHQIVSRLLQPQNPEHAAQKTTTGISFNRVIAQSTRDSVGTYFDSVHLSYGPNRGSNYDYNDMLYPYNYTYNTSPLFNYAGAYTKPQVLFDTLKHWTLDPNTYFYGPYEEDLATYDARENTVTYKSLMKDSAINPNMNFINKFNSHYDIDTAYSFNYIGGVSDSAFRQFFAYNTSHLLTKDSTYEYHSGAWRLVSKTLYTYDGSNNLVLIDNYSNLTDTTFTMPLTEQIQYINTYDGSHRLITVATNYFDGTVLGPYVRDTFGYSGAYTWHNSWKEYQYDPINGYWAPMFNMSKNINMLGLPDTVTIQGYDSILHSWVPQSLEVVSYNTAHYPDTLKEYDYNFTYYPAVPSYTTVYYYQAYLNTLEISALTANNDETHIYPNPVKDQFTIDRLNIASGSSISVSVINANGQIMTRQAMTWHGQAKVSIKEFLPGIYWVLIQDGAGNMVHRQAVVKE